VANLRHRLARASSAALTVLTDSRTCLLSMGIYCALARCRIPTVAVSSFGARQSDGQSHRLNPCIGYICWAVA
jgi:hypothetical protein